MPATIIDGKALAAQVHERVAEAVKKVGRDHGTTPGLATVLVGDDPASEAYVRMKIKRAGEAGIRAQHYPVPADAAEKEVLKVVRQLNDDDGTDGVLVQLPLPAALGVRRVLDSVLPAKDVDGFHIENAGRFAVGLPDVIPCTPLGCMLLLEDVLGDRFAGSEVVVVGRSLIVGRPLAGLLTSRDCTVTLAHSRTRQLAEVCRRADVVVAAAGRAELVRGDWIRPGAVVIDVGVNRVERAGRRVLVGDVAFAEASETARAITPVPGGVGPMTVACLLANTVMLHCRRQGIPVPGSLGSPWTELGAPPA